MGRKGGKIVAPIVIVIAIAVYYTLIEIILQKFNLPTILKISWVVFSIVVTIVLIGVLIERIKEIRSGEEDDLGKY
jgi:uncharacterized membrane protein YidH (DUF202 family)